MSAVMVMDLIEKRLAELKHAIETGNGVGRAQAALERARAGAARKAQRDAERAELQRQIDAARRAAEKREREKQADAVEALLEGAAPVLTLTYAGHTFSVRLAARDALMRGTLLEGARRLLSFATGHYRSLVVRSCETLTVPALPVSDDWFAPLLTRDDMLRPLVRYGELQVDGERVETEDA